MPSAWATGLMSNNRIPAQCLRRRETCGTTVAYYGTLAKRTLIIFTIGHFGGANGGLDPCACVVYGWRIYGYLVL